MRGARGGFEGDCRRRRREGDSSAARQSPVSDAISSNLGAGVAGGRGQFRRARIVGIEDSDTWSGIDRAVEKETLGGKVFFHRLVIVEVVASEVGEDGDIEGDSGHASLIERVA